MVALPKTSGVVVETRMDNTGPAQLKTMGGVVERLMNATELDRARARKRYAEQKHIEGKPPVKALPTRRVLTTTVPEGEEAAGEKEHEVVDWLGAQEGSEEERMIYMLYNEAEPMRTRSNCWRREP